MAENIGIRKAAQRRLKYELNVNMPVEVLYPIERILYKASMNEKFEEYERKIRNKISGLYNIGEVGRGNN